MDCSAARESMSPYLNRDLPDPERMALEAHLFGCLPCQAELDSFRMMLGGLRALPTVLPPADFAARVMARLRTEGFSAGDAQADAPDPYAPTVPGELPAQGVVAAQGPLRLVPPALPSAIAGTAAYPDPPAAAPWPPHGAGAPPSPWGPPAGQAGARERSSPFRSLALVAAVLFAVFTGARFNDRSEGRLALGRIEPRQMLDAMLPVNVSMAHGTRGRAGLWNDAQLALVAHAPQEQPLPTAEVAWHLPPGLQLNVPHELSQTQPVPDECLADADALVSMNLVEHDAPHFIVMPCCIPREGQSAQRFQWRTAHSGRFKGYIELRCNGLYRRAAFDLEAQP